MSAGCDQKKDDLVDGRQKRKGRSKGASQADEKIIKLGGLAGNHV